LKIAGVTGQGVIASLVVPYGVAIPSFLLYLICFLSILRLKKARSLSQSLLEITRKRKGSVRRKVSPYSLVCRRRFMLVKRTGSRSQNPNYATNNFFQLLNFKMTSAIKYQLRIGSKQPVGTNTAFVLLVLHFRNLGRQV